MTTDNAIQSVSLQSAADQLKDKIRLGFAELIPPEQWKAMIEAELVAFTKPRPNPNRYSNSGPERSIFQQLCEATFREFATAEIKKVLDATNAGADFWNQKVGSLVKEWLTENQERLIQTTVLSLAGHAAQGLIATMASRQ